MFQLLVIGGASSDILHLEHRTVASAGGAGGAGLYTAMAECRGSSRVSLFAPRPDPCPEPLKLVLGLLTEWLGPVVSPEWLPQFEISYRSGTTDYLKATYGAIGMLSPTMLPTDLSKYAHVHVTQLGDVTRQLSFIKTCRERGAKQISAGTGLMFVNTQLQEIRAVIQQSNYFLMNLLEAKAVFVSIEFVEIAPEKVLYITLGKLSAYVIQGSASTLVPAISATELDTSGAGDAFCGATLAYLLQGEHPILAARHDGPVVAAMIAQVGPSALSLPDPPPNLMLEPSVRVSDRQVRKLASRISALSQAQPFSYVTPLLPLVGHHKALAYFLLRQFSNLVFGRIGTIAMTNH